MGAIAGLNQDAAELQQRIERSQAVREWDSGAAAAGHRRAGLEVLDQILIALFARRDALPDHGHARYGEDS